MKWINSFSRLPGITCNIPIIAGDKILYRHHSSYTLDLRFDGMPCAGAYIIDSGAHKNCWVIIPFGTFFKKDFKRIEWLDEHESLTLPY